MRKIRVAFFAEILIADFDGAARTMFQLLDRIDRDRFEFLFVCGNGPDKINGFDCIKTPSVRIPLNPKYKLAIPSLNATGITARLEAFKPDVVHIATPSLLGHFGLTFATRRNIPVISIYHTHFVSYIQYYLKSIPFLVKPVERYLIKKQNRFYGECAKVYIPSASLADELASTGMSDRNFRIWQRGIDTHLFSPAKNDTSYLHQVTGNNLPTVLFASRLVWEKNLETLIGMYENARKRGLRCNWVIVGDGAAKSGCMKRMPDATFLGQLGHEELSVVYASATVFVFPSISETFGNVILEAMASGLVPVIADAGGGKDMVMHGRSGFKCRPNDPDDYIEKISLLLGNETLRNEMSANAVLASKAFDWEELAKIYFNDVQALASPVDEDIQI